MKIMIDIEVFKLNFFSYEIRSNTATVLCLDKI